MACAPHILSAHQGRISLQLQAVPMGADLCVALSGGDRPHIGAVALADARKPAAALTLPLHREEDLARHLAGRLSAHTGHTVCVACGIHLEAITPQEITEVLALADGLVDELIGRLGQGPAPQRLP